jgi:hypothetical protein
MFQQILFHVEEQVTASWELNCCRAGKAHGSLRLNSQCTALHLVSCVGN